MFDNLYEAPLELATGGYVTKELHSVTVHFDDIHYSLSSGQLNGGYHHTLASYLCYDDASCIRKS